VLFGDYRVNTKVIFEVKTEVQVDIYWEYEVVSVDCELSSIHFYLG